jgi:peptidoglycan/LPS O-acetylase OafA/YrhL
MPDHEDQGLLASTRGPVAAASLPAGFRGDERECFRPINFKDRFPALDGIRALAILMVFLDHFGGGSHGGHFLQVVNQIRLYGWLGVDIFFVLSGFLITGILFDTRFDSHYFKRFFLRRSVRIFPIFYLVVLLLLILTPILHYHLRAGHLLFLIYLGNFIGNYDFSYYNFISPVHQSMRFNVAHFWSLCVEEQFYMFWPLVVWLVKDRLRLIRVSVGIIIATCLLRALMLHFFGPTLTERWVVRSLPFRLDSLVIGGVLALLLRGPNADAWQRRCRALFFISLLATVTVFRTGGYDHYWFPTIGFTLIALCSAGLVGMTIRTGSVSFRVFNRKPFRTLGKYSYGFYVYHDIFGWTWIQVLVFLMVHLHSIPLAGFLALSGNFVATFFIAKFSYDLFEVRFLRLKRRFEYDSELAAHRHASQA